MGQTAKAHCLVIEDSDNGVAAANAAGIYVVGYRNPLAADQLLDKADAGVLPSFWNLACNGSRKMFLSVVSFYTDGDLAEAAAP